MLAIRLFLLFLVSFLVLVELVYFRGWFQLRTSGKNAISNWRLGAFTCGVMSIGAAVNPPIADLDHRLLCVHMVQHLLLMTIGPALILLGNPFLLIERGLPSSFARSVLHPFLSWAPMQRLGRVLSQPVFCWLIATAVLLGWHLPQAFDLAMRSESWHAIEGFSFFAAGLLFWMRVIRPWPMKARGPQWSIPLYLFLATLPCDALSAFLTFCGRVVYPHYLQLHLHQERLLNFSALNFSALNFSALQDQEAAGALMWVFVTFAYLIPAVVVTIQILSPSSFRRQQETSNDGDNAARASAHAVSPLSAGA
jgi:putative membrane protein